MSWQSRFKEIISNKIFEFFIIFIIIASALTIGVKTYDITPFWLSVLEVADIGITVIFVIEISVRFLEYL
jgi:voltage-gated sodium channel